MALRIAKCVLVIYAWIYSTGADNFLPSIQWTPDNPIFNNLKGQTRKVNEADEIMIWCPKFYTQEIKTTYQLHYPRLYFALYKVETKEEYDNCDARKGKRYLTCNDPAGRSTKDTEYRQIAFMKPFSENMDPYIPGKTYYFIGTSGGTEEDIDKTVGGKCSSHNMKFAVYVCKKEENCNVDVLNGGWSLWKVNEETGLCERNCTKPAPQNGGYPCNGPDKMDCSKIISGKKQNPTTSKESTTAETTTIRKTTKETTSTMLQQEKTNATTATRKTLPTTDTSTSSTKIQLPTTKPTVFIDNDSDESNTDANADKLPNRSEDDDVRLSTKGAILTFVGLFILGCVVGIVQVLVILHVRSKRSSKQPEPQCPVNHV